jgi:hypothetical protein
LNKLTVGPTSKYLISFAACGWLILVANLFPLARSTNGIFPVVDDLTGLVLSTLLLLILAMTPVAFRQMIGSGPSSKK